MTEMFRIKLGNVPKHLRAPTISKFVTSSLKLSTDGVQINTRKERYWNYCFVNISAPDGMFTMSSLISSLNGLKLKSNILKAEEEKYEPIPKNEDRSVERNLNDQVTPLWHLPYEEQLLFKQENMKSTIMECICPTGSNNSKDIIFDEPVASPQVFGYRNKCEFSFGKGYRDGEPTLGFLLGAYKEGIVTVESPKDCLHISDAFKRLVQMIEAFIRQPNHQLPIFDRLSKKGFYRLLLVRQVGPTDLMVGLQVAPPASSSLTPEQHAEAINQFSQLMQRFEFHPDAGNETENVIRVKSFQVQVSESVHHGLDPKAPFKIIFGPEHVITRLRDLLQFRVSLESFFQVNTSCIPLLYDKIKEYSLIDKPDGNSLLLDVCCGTGTIGLWLADRFDSILGVELVTQAVQDAQFNAQLNDIQNAKFSVGRAEDASFWQTIHNEKASNNNSEEKKHIVAVLDPPRAGVHGKVLKAINKLEHIRRIILVSCDLKAVANSNQPGSNLNHLYALGWKLTRVGLVDMFPHTAHYETVMCFERTN